MVRMVAEKYMNLDTGEIGSYEDMDFTDEDGKASNLVERGRAIMVLEDEDGNYWREA